MKLELKIASLFARRLPVAGRLLAGGIALALAASAAAQNIQSVTYSSMTLSGGSTVVATVDLKSAAGTGGCQLKLSSSTPITTVPASMTIAKGEGTGTFTVQALPVTNTTTSIISVKNQTGQTVSTTLTIKPPAPSKLTSVSFAPDTIWGGCQSATGVVTLNGPAPAGGLEITLTVSDSTLSVPSSVTVPANESETTFTGASIAVSKSHVILVQAQDPTGNKASSSLTIDPVGYDLRPLTPGDTFTYNYGGKSGWGTNGLSGQVTDSSDGGWVTEDVHAYFNSFDPIKDYHVQYTWAVASQAQWLTYITEYPTPNWPIEGPVVDNTDVRPLKLSLGAQVKGGWTWTGRTYSESFRVIGIDSVNTPAGTYICWVLANGPLTGILSLNTTEIWISPKLGYNFVKMIVNYSDKSESGWYGWMINSTNVQ